MIFKKIIGTVLAAVVACTTALTVSAQSLTNDGLTTEIISDNNYYTSEDVANVVIKVTNNNDFDVTNITAESVLPEGLVLAEGSETEASAQTLESGESVKFTLKVMSAAAQTDEASQVQNSSQDSSYAAQNTTASAVDSKQSDNPQTGSSAGAAALAVLLTGALATGCIVSRKNKRVSKFMSLLICSAFVGMGASYIKVSAESDTSNYSTTGVVFFDEQTYEIVAVTSYDSIVTDSAKTYTRGEWVKLLAELEDITAENISEDCIDWHYGDTMGTEDGKLYELLYAMDIIPQADNEGYTDPEQDVALFEADKEVTREYAAYTAVKALGFEEEEPSLDCADCDLITYQSEVTTALKFNMLSLINGNFEPNGLINEADRNQIAAVIRALDENLIADEDDTVCSITYADGVIADELSDITDYTAVEEADGAYTLSIVCNDVTEKFQEGTVIVLPSNEQFESGAAFKISSVTNDGAIVTAACTVADISEAAKAVYVKDTVTADADEFIPEEGLSAQILDSSESSGDAAPLNLDKDFNNDIVLKISCDLPQEKGEASVSLSIPRISVAYKSHTDWDWFNSKYVVDEFLIAATTKTDIEVEGKFAEISADDTRIKLGTLPIKLPVGFNINVNVYLYAEATGSFTVGFTAESTSGIQYINGSWRRIKNSNSSLSKIELGASIEVGISPTLNFTWTILPDLIGAEVKTGIAAETKATLHPDADLVCLDATVFLPLKLTVSHDSVFGEFMKEMKVELTWTIFDSSNSPLKSKLHIENLKPVEECTYGKGAISVVVKNSDGEPISGAKVRLTDADGNLIKSTFTTSDGKLTAQNVDPGQVVVEITATGFKKYTSRELVYSKQTTYMEAVLMILREDETDEDNNIIENTVSGSITDAVTGDSINASFSVRKGTNASADEEVVASGTSENGEYSITLPTGYYTITFSKDGYVDSSVNVNIDPLTNTSKNVVLSQQLNAVDTNASLRIVLTWGENPSDLDSHLLSTSDSSYHIYFSDMNYYDDNSNLKASLDIDDTSSYGPETVTIYSTDSGEKFSYYIHNFSDRNDPTSTSLSESGARIAVYSGDSLVGIYNVPIDVEGNLWHVFDYDPERGALTAVNTFHQTSDSEYRDYFIDRY